MPTIPNILPNLDESGCDKPLRAKINNRAEIRYKIATMFADIYETFFCFFGFFLNIDNMRYVTIKPPKILTDANTTAIIPNIFEISYPRGPAARIAPTIITLEIAFVTPIRGLCKAGVTDQTT